MLALATDRTEQFVLLADLGVIEAPPGYVHEARLQQFAREHDFAHYNACVNDLCFAQPTRILRPGDRLRVQVFDASAPTSSEERLAFLRRRHDNVLVGAQGLSLVYALRRGRMWKDRWYMALDEKSHLRHDALGHRVPMLRIRSADQLPHVDLGVFEQDWGNTLLLGFQVAE